LNIWVEKAALHLDLPNVKIIKEDLPIEVLSDLESDAENVSMQEKRCVKEAGLEGVANKWMSRTKIWTSPEVRHWFIIWDMITYVPYIPWFQLECLKDLAKQVNASITGEATEANPASKKAPTTPQFRGPSIACKPVSMRNVQDWMVDVAFLGDDATSTCMKNRDPPFTHETILTLVSLFSTAWEMCLNKLGA
jgi:hypothetical protein